ncbi:hypothetical protein Acr_08g0019500 [Actinidia rufa]|uniref:Uncharacterized protein n=1 Tax=Actinidia rufa TaxID=165716 RepID=A0A7J0F4F2_9ERIC|nr:hypothetical protein Acr_08g0019500 [Actinidia rufa]
MANTALPRSANPLLMFGPRLSRRELPVQSAVVLPMSERRVHVFSEFGRRYKSNRLQGGCSAEASVIASDDKFYGNLGRRPPPCEVVRCSSSSYTYPQ